MEGIFDAVETISVLKDRDLAKVYGVLNSSGTVDDLFCLRLVEGLFQLANVVREVCALLLNLGLDFLEGSLHLLEPREKHLTSAEIDWR